MVPFGDYTLFDDLMLPYAVDLAMYGQVRNPNLLAYIQQAGVVFYQVRGVDACPLNSSRRERLYPRSTSPLVFAPPAKVGQHLQQVAVVHRAIVIQVFRQVGAALPEHE
jgi:hypothetical protein